MKKFVVVLCAMFLMLCIGSVNASTITFLHEGSGSGTIGQIDFSNATFSISAIGDTDHRGSFGSLFWIDHNLATITIDGIGTYEFVTPTRTFVYNPSGVVGFSHAGQWGLDLFDGPTNPLFNSWFMLSTIGPVVGNGDLMQWGNSEVNTDGGVLFFETTDWDVTTTFTATVGDPVPEPATMLLFSLGLLGLAGVSRRKK